MVVLDFKLPGKWPRWLVKFFELITRPFGVSLDLADRKPWQVMEKYFTAVTITEVYGGLVYIAVGDKFINKDKMNLSKFVKKISGARAAFLALLIVGGYFLWSEHRAHLLEALPYLILLACPLMHVFMHHDHGNRKHHGDEHMSRAQHDKGEQNG